MGFFHGDGTVTAESEGVQLKTEIRLVFDGWLNPDRIDGDAILVRSGTVPRATDLRWDFQVGDDFDDLTNDEPAYQMVAIRLVSGLEADNQYRVIVTDELRGLFDEPVEPFEGIFRTGSDPGTDLPEEPPASPVSPGALFQGQGWRTSTVGSPTAVATCGWLYGPCHRLLDLGHDYGTEDIDYSLTTPAMKLMLCEYPATIAEGCTPVFNAPAPWKDLYATSAQWPGMRIVEPGQPGRSYLLYKLLGVPGIEGSPMPACPTELCGGLRPQAYLVDDAGGRPIENRSNFIRQAQLVRQWIAAGAQP